MVYEWTKDLKMEIDGAMSMLTGVPEGKKIGICEWPGQTDGGTATTLANCADKCGLWGCLMFGDGEVDNKGKTIKRFTEHQPEY